MHHGYLRKKVISLISPTHLPNGLKAEYYDNPTFQGTPKTRVDKGINFEPKNQAPDPFLPKSPLSIRWTGELVPNISGEYVFRLHQRRWLPVVHR